VIRLALTFAAVGPAVAAGYLGATGGERATGAIVAMMLLAAVFAGVRLAADRDLTLPARDSPAVGTAVRVTGAGLVVASSIVGAVGWSAAPAQAQGLTTNPDCDIVDNVLTGVTFTWLDQLRDPEDRCLQYETTDYANASEEQAYQQALVSNRTAEQYRTKTLNQVQILRSAAWGDAKVELVECVKENGTTKAECSDRALNESLEPVTASLNNSINRMETQMVTAASLNTSVRNQYGYEWTNRSTEVGYILPNGVNRSMQAQFVDDGSDEKVSISEPGDWSSINGAESINYTAQPASTSVVINPDLPLQNQGPFIAYNASGQRQTGLVMVMWWSRIMWEHERIETDLRQEIPKYANTTYEAIENGSVNVSDVTASAPSAVARNAGSDYNETGSNAYLNAQLAALGLEGGNASHVVETTRTFTVVDNGSVEEVTRDVTITGSIYVYGANNTTLPTNEEIDPDATEGQEVLTVASVTYDNGTPLNYSSPYWWFDRNYTIVEATNPETGEAVNTTTYQGGTSYATSDPGNLREDLRQSEKAEQQYLDTTVGGGGGGIGGIFDPDGDGDVNPLPVLAVAVGAVGLILLLGQGGGSVNVGGR
jgi:hypothetical protein